MPSSAMKGLPVTFCLNLADIGAALEPLVRRTARFETGLAVAVRTLRDHAGLLVRLVEQSGQNRETPQFLTNELTALRRDIRSVDDLIRGSLAELTGQKGRVARTDGSVRNLTVFNPLILSGLSDLRFGIVTILHLEEVPRRPLLLSGDVEPPVTVP